MDTNLKKLLPFALVQQTHLFECLLQYFLRTFFNTADGVNDTNA